MNEATESVRRQFGAAAAAYVTSDIHSAGESLGLLRRMIPAQSTWRALDVASGTGHTALAFAPVVAEVVALDVTEPMLAEARNLAVKRGVTNLRCEVADVHALPFADGSFDLVTCRLAMHHFADIEMALRETHRVLRPGGWFGLTDNFVIPENSDANLYNEFERLRDPSHVLVRSVSELDELLEKNGFEVQELAEIPKEFEFHAWADRQNCAPQTKRQLETLVRNLPESLAFFLRPRWEANTFHFTLWEVLFAATRR